MSTDKDMSTSKHKSSTNNNDDSLAYARSLERAGTNHTQETDNPLAAVKDMRLQQLAACRIKTAKELQDKMSKMEDDQ